MGASEERLINTAVEFAKIKLERAERYFERGYKSESYLEGYKEAEIVYFMQADNGLIKIGKSSPVNIKRRLQGLRAGSPCSLKLLYCFSGTKGTEKQLHFALADYRKHGEWFSPGLRLINMLPSDI